MIVRPVVEPMEQYTALVFSISDKLTGHSGFFSVMVPAVTGSGRGRERDSGREPRLGRPGHSGGSVVTRGHCVM